MMSTSPNDAAPDPDLVEDEAADARPQLSRRAWLAVGAGLAVLIGVAAWFGWGQATQEVRWQDVGYEIDSPTEASATFDVFLYTDEVVTCHVQALNVQYAEVGVGQVDVDPAAGAEQRITVDIATVEEATTALVRYCDVE